MPSRLTTANPGRVNVSVYSPGTRERMRYWPESLVTVVRCFSMRAGLDASTVTPGNTPPEASLTTPAISAWACAKVGTISANSAHTHKLDIPIRCTTASLSLHIDGCPWPHLTGVIRKRPGRRPGRSAGTSAGRCAAEYTPICYLNWGTIFLVIRYG